MTNNISFKSKINFVKNADFHRLKSGKYVDFNPANDMFVKASSFYTESVRTCTAGGLIDTTNKEAVGFHFFDCENVCKNIRNYVDEMFKLLKKPDKVFLLGGKRLKDADFSMEQFQTLKDILTLRVDKITCFEEHKLPWSETDLHYSAKDDCWNIHTMMRYRTD